MLIKLRGISIRNKLILMQVFTSVLVLLIVFTVFIITDIRGYKQRKIDSMLGLAQVLAANNVSTLQFMDNEAAHQILSELHDVAPDILHAAIIDSTGRTFAKYVKDTAVGMAIPKDLPNNGYVLEYGRLYVTSLIVADKKVLGKVMLEVELSELEKIKREKFELAGILLVIAIASSFLIALLIQPYISKRLLMLVNTMKDAGSTGDYSKPLVDEGKDEISTLVRVYNSLMVQVKESQRRKEEFIGIASHELKTPLTTIKGYIDLIDSMEDQQPKKQFVQKALENVQKLERLIKDLLDVSKMQSGQLELNVQEFDMGTLLEESIAGFRMVSGTHKITWNGDHSPGMIRADRQRIEQVMVNLLSNAIKYSPGEKEVLVNSSSDGEEMLIMVQDHGPGIPAEELPNIFDRFYRTKDTSIHISGFGLGLYICKDIIDRHHGKIWVESTKEGSAFYFSLPMKYDKSSLTNVKPV
ncbi:ATP-binding protein [Ferruginibacter sp. HRS2-29]|uniref:ATP-binding protein n=1 Tax=Ferruginibacter sp. HRS2-29 TaxID=2487334 RepID=UPI0020CE6D9C|nr:ATP-binding protein [Ferruginibacter sp. HRS2-29]MCP9750077.1 hypothetical protein [Ferruginibacter sp. HRS2-29]